MTIKQFYIEGVDFIRQLYLNRILISELTKRDFRSSYVRNVLGLSWAIVEPLFLMIILMLVFTYLRTRKSADFPFSVYLLSGLIAFDFFNKTINKTTKSIKAFEYLVKKVNFRVAIIPIVKISSELILHLIIVGIVGLILIFSGVYPSLYWLQLLYYIFASCMLLLGLSWLTSSVQLFFPDISTVIGLMTRLLFFVTPIFWSIDMFPPRLAFLVQLNPLAYIVMGYRDSFLYQIPFWDKLDQTLVFWGITMLFLFLGVVVFKKLRPHFADVI